MIIVDEDNTNEQEFINSLIVDDIETASDAEGGNNKEIQEAPQEVVNNSKNTVNAYLLDPTPLETTTLNQPLPHSIYAKTTKLLAQFNQNIHTTADSGAKHDMSGIKSMFEEFFPLTDNEGGKPFALLGDGSTTCAIEGYGYATYRLNRHPFRKLQLYVPALKNSHLTSILQHSKYKGCYFHSKNKKATLAFPPAMINADCKGEITIKIDPITTAAERSTITYMFDKQYATPASHDTTKVAFYPATCNQFIEQENTKNLTETVKIQKLGRNAKIPEQATDRSVGYDLHHPISTIIPANQSIKIPLNFALSTPSGLYPRITNSSSLASKGITIRRALLTMTIVVTSLFVSTMRQTCHFASQNTT